jgi:hypothetical protein
MNVLGFLAALMRALRARWLDWRAAIAWSVGSWLRPADAEAGWEQDSARGKRRG